MQEIEPLSRADRIAGGLVGLLVGDALGVPYEFHPPADLPPLEQIEMEPPAGFDRAHRSVPPGTWSDDGAHALVLLESLLARDGLDLEHLGAGLVRWSTEGHCAVESQVFDIGKQTHTAIARLRSGTPADRSGSTSERDNGNGSLMRVLPLVLWHAGADEELIELAARQSLPTHGHARAQVACAMYCLWARAVLDGLEQPWDAAAARLRELAPRGLLPLGEVELVLDSGNADATTGRGYVLDCLWSARVAFEFTSSYEACVKRAIAFGNDTDTTAAVAGGIAGLGYGLSGIPERWRNDLRGAEIYRPLLEALLALRCA